MFKQSFLLILIALATTSCEKVIDLKLKSSSTQYVIKGNVVAGDSIHEVSITKSIPFDQSNIFPTVDGATVTLSDDQGNSTVLTYQGNGTYLTSNFTAYTDRTYTLMIEHDENTFKASCYLPKVVPLLGVVFLKNEFFGESGKIIVPQFQDPSDVVNYYSFSYFNVNKPDKETGLLIRDDENTNGQMNQQPLFDGFTMQPKDTIRLTMSGIAKEVYTFYYSKNLNTSGNTGAPANPVNNWSNNALGYFTAQNEQVLDFVVPE
jgi:hypothetical protein